MYRYRLKLHIEGFHFNLGRNYPCEVCDFTTSKFRELVLHKKTDHADLKKEAIEQCSVCDQKYKGPVASILLRRHLGKVHGIVVGNFQCDICGTSTLTKRGLITHLEKHMRNRERSFHCNICNKAFSKRDSLQVHMSSHQEERNSKLPHTYWFNNLRLIFFVTFSVSCEYCGKLFKHRNTLNAHLKTHQEPRFVCDIDDCGRKFGRKQNWIKHKKAHRGERDHQCDQCDMSFFCKMTLNQHKQSIHERLYFICEAPNCKGSFSRRGYYRKHVKEKHQNLSKDKMNELLEKVNNAVSIKIKKSKNKKRQKMK